MNTSQLIHLRITRNLYAQIMDDLRRPHPHAYERVGFLFAKSGNNGNNPLLLIASAYQSVPDDQYVEDQTCGARIGSEAIRGAMQHVLSFEESGIHIHLHEHPGQPGFSGTDLREGPKIVAGLRNARPQQPHGMAVLSDDHGTVNVWLPDSQKATPITRISIIGWPTTFYERNTHD